MGFCAWDSVLTGCATPEAHGLFVARGLAPLGCDIGSPFLHFHTDIRWKSVVGEEGTCTHFCTVSRVVRLGAVRTLLLRRLLPVSEKYVFRSNFDLFPDIVTRRAIAPVVT